MWAYQKVGMVGGIITLVVSILFSFVTTYLAANRFTGALVRHYLPMSIQYMNSIVGASFAFFMGMAIIGIIAGILGIIGAGTRHRVGGGVLLIIGAIMSLAVAFGIFGIGFILMFVGGILGLASSQRIEERRPLPREEVPPAAR
jgi:hypothetical protein